MKKQALQVTVIAGNNRNRPYWKQIQFFYFAYCVGAIVTIWSCAGTLVPSYLILNAYFIVDYRNSPMRLGVFGDFFALIEKMEKPIENRQPNFRFKLDNNPIVRAVHSFGLKLHVHNLYVLFGRYVTINCKSSHLFGIVELFQRKESVASVLEKT